MHPPVGTPQNLQGFFILQRSIRSPYFQLAWEEGLALAMHELNIPFGVRVWKNHQTIVLGISEKETKTIHKKYLEYFWKYTLEHPEHLRKKKLTTPLPIPWMIARRCSGGGTVTHTLSGNTNFSIFVDHNLIPEFYPVRSSYEILLGLVQESLQELHIPSELAGKSDLSMQDQGILKKISGNSQFRKKNITVLHGTIILDSELISEIEKIQHHPPEEPSYRNKRSHKEFLTSIPKSHWDEEKFALSLFQKVQSYTIRKIQNRKEKIEDKSPQVPDPEGKPSPSRNPSHLFNFLKRSLVHAEQLFQSKYSKWEWIFREYPPNENGSWERTESVP